MRTSSSVLAHSRATSWSTLPGTMKLTSLISRPDVSVRLSARRYPSTEIIVRRFLSSSKRLPMYTGLLSLVDTAKTVCSMSSASFCWDIFTASS